MTVAELLSRVSSRELSEWMAFFELEPFGWEAGLYGHALTASTVMNAQRTKQSQRLFEPQDFMPKRSRSAPGFFSALKANIGRMSNGNDNKPARKARA